MTEILLIFFVIAEPAPLELTVTDLTKAPTFSPMPEGLPDPRTAPDNGKWLDHDGKQRFSGTFLPAPLDSEILKRLRLLEQVPGFVQVQIDQVIAAERQRAKGMVEVTKARCIADKVRAGPRVTEGWSNFQMIGAIVLAAGFGAGIVAISNAASK